jgi:uncharacterized protein (TIGR03435 family)
VEQIGGLVVHFKGGLHVTFNEGLQRVSLCFLFAASAALAQPSAPLAFEVATIKPSVPVDMAALRDGRAHVGTKIDAGRVDIGTASLFQLICVAYRLRPYQVTGPDWLKTTMYDIQAKIPSGATAVEVPEMLRTLLEDRFGLKIHHESKDQPVYALVVAKGGPKLKESTPDPTTPADPQPPTGKPSADTVSMPTAQGNVKLTRTATGINIEMPGGEISGKIRVTLPGPGTPPRLHLETSGVTMKTFAEMLSVGVVDRPVVDMTGLSSSYELAVDLSIEDATKVARASINIVPVGGGGGGGGGDAGKPRPEAGGRASDPSGPSILESIQNLGLKLEPRKLPLDALVVDRMERSPTAN